MLGEARASWGLSHEMLKSVQDMVQLTRRRAQRLLEFEKEFCQGCSQVSVRLVLCIPQDSGFLERWWPRDPGLLVREAFQGTEHPQHFPQIELWPAAAPEAHGHQESLEKALPVVLI